MYKIILVLVCIFSINCQAMAFQPISASKYLQSISGLSTGSYKPDGMGGYFACSKYKMLDNASNLAYYVEGMSDKKSSSLYLLLNVYKTSNKSKMHSNLLSASRLLTLKALNQKLNNKLVQCLLTGSPVKVKQGKYTIEVKRDNWITGLGYSVKFIIKEF